MKFCSRGAPIHGDQISGATLGTLQLNPSVFYIMSTRARLGPVTEGLSRAWASFFRGWAGLDILWPGPVHLMNAPPTIARFGMYTSCSWNVIIVDRRILICFLHGTKHSNLVSGMTLMPLTITWFASVFVRSKASETPLLAWLQIQI